MTVGFQAAINTVKVVNRSSQAYIWQLKFIELNPITPRGELVECSRVLFIIHFNRWNIGAHFFFFYGESLKASRVCSGS